MMRSQPFYGHIADGRIRPEENALCGGRKVRMETVGDGKSDAGGWLRRASLHTRHRQEEEQTEHPKERIM